MAGMVSKWITGALVASALAFVGCEFEEDPLPGDPSAGGNAGSGATAPGGSAGAAGAVGVAGTGSSGAPGSAGTTGSSGNGNVGGGAAVRSAGCGRAAQLTSGARSLEVDGQTRTYILDLPGDYDQNEAYPVLFAFHGRGFSGAEFREDSYGGLLAAAGDDAIVLHPDALGEVERAWDFEGQSDVRFFDALLDAVDSGLCIDESRVFAAGHSSGGYFTNTLACARGDSLRAIAPVAGGGPFGSDGNPPDCERPLSAWIAHSESDQTVLFSNGENSRDYWRNSDECSQGFDSVAPAPCVAFQGCGAGLAVNWCVYAGGHDWPSFAAQAIWSFFRRF
jgi:polyhydroxybutyrate depolymerase